MRSKEFHEWTSISYGKLPDGIRPWRFYDYEPKGSGKPVFLPEPQKEPESISIQEGEPIPIDAISTIMHYACGPTHRIPWGATAFTFRAAPSAGALYPYEVYIAAKDVGGLDAGLHGFRHDYGALELCEPGEDIVRELADAAFIDEAPPFLVVVTGLVFRSAEKYGDRGYRYTLLDIGHVLLNLSWTARLAGIDGTHILDFNDAPANSAVCADVEFEEVFAMWIPESVSLPGRCELEGRKASHRYRAIEFHRETYAVGLKKAEAAEIESACSLPPFDIPEAIRNRRSKREFIRASLDAPHEAVLREALQCALAERTSTAVARPKPLVLRIFADGEWQLDDFETGVAVSEGKDVGPLVHAALGQEFCGQACVWLVLAADLEGAEREFGTRAYRHLFMLSGLFGESIYLAASAAGLGACGIGAFCDEDLREALKLPPDKTPLYFVCAGYTK